MEKKSNNTALIVVLSTVGGLLLIGFIVMIIALLGSFSGDFNMDHYDPADNNIVSQSDNDQQTSDDNQSVTSDDNGSEIDLSSQSEYDIQIQQYNMNHGKIVYNDGYFYYMSSGDEFYDAYVFRSKDMESIPTSAYEGMREVDADVPMSIGIDTISIGDYGYYEPTSFGINGDYIYYISKNNICRYSLNNQRDGYIKNWDVNGNTYDEVLYEGSDDCEYGFILTDEHIIFTELQSGSYEVWFMSLDGKESELKDYSTGSVSDIYSIGNNVYYIAEGWLKCLNLDTTTCVSVVAVPSDIQLEEAMGDKLYFQSEKVKQTDVLDDTYERTVYVYTQSQTELTEYEVFDTSGSGSIFITPDGKLYADTTAGGGTVLFEVENGNTERVDGATFNANKAGINICDHSIYGADFYGEKYFVAVEF